MVGDIHLDGSIVAFFLPFHISLPTPPPATSQIGVFRRTVVTCAMRTCQKG